MKTLTPEQVRSRALAAHSPLIAVLDRAKVQKSTFWRWEKGTHEPRELTLRKIADALAAIEKERAL